MRTGARRSNHGQFSFARRAFVVSLTGICAVLSVSFFAVSVAVRTAIKAGIRDSLQRTEQSMDRVRAGRSFKVSLILQLFSEDPSFSSAVRRTLSARRGTSRRAAVGTILEHLLAVRDATGSDVVAVSDTRGNLLAALPGDEPAMEQLAEGREGFRRGIGNAGGTFYAMAATSIRARGRKVGVLAAGTKFDLAGLEKFGPAALVRGGRLVRSTFPSEVAAQVAGRLSPGCARTGCELRIGAEDFLVMPVNGATNSGDQDQLLIFRSIDGAMDEILRPFRWVLPAIGICSVLLAVCISLLASRAVSRPIQQLIARLAPSEASGRLRADFPENSPTREINQLAVSLNGAAIALERSNARLDHAYIEFVETMAQALDARDPYTAGHSIRVRDIAIAIAQTMHLSPEEIEVIRVGAQLHDIGKIGIPDALLQKAGYLTPEEYEIVKLHPQIGKRILERVGRFEEYLPIVELHHEDQDGSGYPYGLKGHEVPLAVRIVHVADVYDALTSNRAYRVAMSPHAAREIVDLCSGVQFDPEVVQAFSAILRSGMRTLSSDIDRLAGLALG